MGRIRTFDIVIDNNDLAPVGGVPVYIPGGHVTGVVHLTLNAPRDDVKEISIKLQGRANTLWSDMVESRASVFSSQSVTFSGTETYVDEKMSLWQQARPRQWLNRGPYEFPFQFQVPNENLPPPYEGASGHVRYRLKCEISGDSSFSYTKVSKIIAIAGRPLDLNGVPSAMLPVHGESESLLSLLCCLTGSIKVHASADKQAYVPGETAYITAIVRGSSGTRYDVVLKLIEEATFRGTGSVFNSPGVSVARAGTCQRSREITRKKTSGVLQRRGETTLQREPMVIPNDRPITDSGFQECSIIDIHYFISVAPTMSRLRHSDDTEIRLPITIGHVPFTALPSYHASNAHMGHPNEPPPSYEIATSFRHTTSDQAISNTAFVNQAYTPMMEETTPTTSRDQGGLIVALPPLASSLPRDVVSNQTEASEEQRFRSRDQQERSLPPIQMTPVYTEMGIHGFVNPSFSEEVRYEEYTLSQDGDRDPAAEEQSSSDAEQQQETLVQDEDVVLQAPLPPPSLLSSPTEEITTDSHVTTSQANRRPEDDLGDRTPANESGTMTYFLPAYERKLLGRLAQEDNTEQNLEPVGGRVSLQSFFLPIHQDSDSVDLQDAELLTDQIKYSRDTLSPPSPWKDEQPSLSIFPAQEGKNHSPLEDNVQPSLVEEEIVNTSSFQNQGAAPALIKTYTWKEYVSISTEVDKDYQNKEIITPDVSEDILDSEAAEVSFMPIYTIPQRSHKSNTNRDVNCPASLSDFAEGSSSKSAEASLEKHSRAGKSLKRQDRPSCLAPLSRNQGLFDSSPVSPLKESLFGNVRIVHDNSREESRTPSPYFHPDDGRGDQDEASSVSSFGSYSPITHVSRERRRTPQDKDQNHAKSSDPGGGGDVSTMPRSKSSSRGLRESALGSLDRRGRVPRHSTSHRVSQQGSKPDPRSCSSKGRNSTFDLRLRGDPRKVQHTVSLPNMDWQSTKSSASRRLAARLDNDDANRSRELSKLKSDPFISSKMQSSSQLSQKEPSHFGTQDTSRPHPNLLRSRENSIKKRSSYTFAIDNLPDATPRQLPPERRKAPSSKQHLWESLVREDNPERIKSCLAYAYTDRDDDDVDEDDWCGSNKQRLETFV